jgi:high-affinity iron transporter
MERQGHTLILPEMRKITSLIGKSDTQAEQFQANAEQSRRSAAPPFLLRSLKWQGFFPSFRYDARPPFMIPDPDLTVQDFVPEPERTSSISRPMGVAGWVMVAAAVLFVTGIMVWQGVTAAGAPDPTKPATSPLTALFDIGVLVFREGLECILVLSSIMAGMNGPSRFQRRPIAWGAGAGMVATVLTWFIAIGIVGSLSESVSALNLQAGTGLLAVVVLLVIMNWFFHKVYWGGWISLHNRRKKELVNEAAEGLSSRARLLWGLGLLGFSSLYREGFEVVLFLQTYRLQMGDRIVLSGAGLGMVLSGIMAVLTFIAHRRLPYRKMLVLTGVMLGAVLLLMVGEQAQEMQLAHWIPTTKISWLTTVVPDWAGVWFSIFPTVETLAAQGIAAVLVIGSYFAARRQFSGRNPREPLHASN